ncbi:MAG: sugar transferase [Clostridia bacterium]|nr:sugar transferase [Clostridia bacterium]
MDLAKVKNNKFLLYIVLSTILFIMSFTSLQMGIITLLIVSFFVFNLNLEEGFCLFLYTISFSRAYTYFSIFYFFSFVCVLIFTIKAFKLYGSEKWKNKSKKFKLIVLISLIYLMVQPIIYAIVFPKISNVLDLATLYTFLLFFIFTYLTFGKISLRKAVLSLAGGIIVGCLIAVLGYFTSLVDYARLFVKDGDLYRFSGLTPHPNSLARNCAVTLALLLFLIFKSQHKIKYYFIFALVGIFGLITFSKAYFLLLLIMFGFAFVFSFISSTNKKVWFKGFAILFVAMIIALIVLIPYLESIFERFFMYAEGTSALNKITTGRVEIWKAFAEVQFSNPFYVIFGKSMSGNIPIDIGIHSTYFALFYQYGIVGFVIFMLFIYTIFKNLKNYNRCALAYLPLILMICAAVIGDHIFIHTGNLNFGMALLTLSACSGELSNEKNNKVEDNNNCNCQQDNKNCFFGKYFIDEFYSKVYLFFKRTIDIVVSLLGLIILSIPMIIVGVLVKATSKGPVFFKDKRIGKDGKQIVVLKFRSMFIDAESRLEEYLTKEQYEMWLRERKVENDPRITKIGKFIRKTSLDELPQLINILKGDLSLIGNRPISKLEYDTHFTEDEKKELDKMRPGLTGYWQVYGRSGVHYDNGERQKMCLHYVRKAGFWLDVKIFFKTFWVVIFRRGAK